MVLTMASSAPVKGGFAQSDLSEPQPFEEAWGFIPEEFFSTLTRMRNNEPAISSDKQKALLHGWIRLVFIPRMRIMMEN